MSLPKLYDLVFTDRRLVGIVTVKTGKARLAGQLLGGVVGNAIAGSIAKGGADQRRASYAGQSLDQIVTRDKANFAAAYTDIENPPPARRGSAANAVLGPLSARWIAEVSAPRTEGRGRTQPRSEVSTAYFGAHSERDLILGCTPFPLRIES